MSTRQSQSQSKSRRRVEFQAVLRLRPLAKKERDDPILIEPLPPQQQHHHQSTTSTDHAHPTSVVLHPAPQKAAATADILSPSSALVRQNQHLSPSAAEGAAAAIALEHDREYALDRVFGPHDDQDRLYFALGLPVALSAMEPLKASSGASDSDGPSSSSRRKNHLVVGMGVAGSGRTHSCFGGPAIHPHRKHDSDGLVPRIVESLFSQSRHHLMSVPNNNSNTHNHHRSNNSAAGAAVFAVNLSILQVRQPKHNNYNKRAAAIAAAAAAGSSADGRDCEIHDLLQPVAPRTFSLSTAGSLSTFSRTSSHGSVSIANSISNRSPVIENIKHLDATAARQTSNGSNSQYSRLEEPVFVEQQEHCSSATGATQQPEFRVVNGQVRTCRSAEQAREALQVALKQAARLSNPKRNHSHLLVTLQPVLVDPTTSQTIRAGGTIAVLDMAGYDLHHGAASRSKESVPNQNDAHAAILHCLRTHQTNEEIRHQGGGDGNNQSAPGLHDDHADDSSDHRPSAQRRQSFKKVPYRQHTLTMLLQPLFASTDVDTIRVCLLLTAYPGHRDYTEKKALLNDVACFRGGPPAQEAATGLLRQASSTSTTASVSSSAYRKVNKKDKKKKKKKNDRRRSQSKRGTGDHNTKKKKVVYAAVAMSSSGHVSGAGSASDADDELSPTKRTLSPMQVPLEITSFNPTAVAPGRTHCSSNNVFSAGDDENDDGYATIEPLPPPVAPGYVDSRLHRLPGSQHRRSGFCTSSAGVAPAATAPVDFDFEHPRAVVSDFPGVDVLMSPASVKSILSEESGPPPPPVPGLASYRPEATAATAVAAATTASAPYSEPSQRIFSPMKTFNKVVKVSKKTGQHVIEKMGNLTSDYPNREQQAAGAVDYHCHDYRHDDMERKLQSLEVENRRIVLENETLKCKNEKLQSELEELRARHNGDRTDREKEERNSVAADSPSVASRQEDWDRYQSENKTSLVDSCLLQHMANMAGGGGGYLDRTEHSSRTCPWAAAPGAPSASSSLTSSSSNNVNNFSLKYPSSFQRTGCFESRDDSF